MRNYATNKGNIHGLRNLHIMHIRRDRAMAACHRKDPANLTNRYTIKLSTLEQDLAL